MTYTYSTVVWPNDSLGFSCFLSWDQIRNSCENLHQMSQSGLGIKQYLGPKSVLKVWIFGFGLKTPVPRSLLAKSYPCNKIRYLYYRGMIWPKRLFGVGVIWPKDSLVPGLNQHQGIFWPDHPNTKESFCQIPPKLYKGHFPEFTFAPRSHLAKPL